MYRTRSPVLLPADRLTCKQRRENKSPPPTSCSVNAKPAFIKGASCASLSPTCAATAEQTNLTTCLFLWAQQLYICINTKSFFLHSATKGEIFIHEKEGGHCRGNTVCKAKREKVSIQHGSRLCWKTLRLPPGRIPPLEPFLRKNRREKNPLETPEPEPETGAGWYHTNTHFWHEYSWEISQICCQEIHAASFKGQLEASGHDSTQTKGTEEVENRGRTRLW